MSFKDEIEKYTDDEIDIIIETQKELYSEEEISQLMQLQNKRKKIKEEARQKEILNRLPKTIVCEKCGGPNSFSNENCEFCGYKLDKDKYYEDKYYEQNSNKTNELDDVGSKEEDKGESYTFHYIISILIPLVGFILGAVMLGSDDSGKCSRGKVCIILGIVSAIVSGVVLKMIYF